MKSRRQYRDGLDALSAAFVEITSMNLIIVEIRSAHDNSMDRRHRCCHCISCSPSATRPVHVDGDLGPGPIFAFWAEKGGKFGQNVQRMPTTTFFPKTLKAMSSGSYIGTRRITSTSKPTLRAGTPIRAGHARTIHSLDYRLDLFKRSSTSRLTLPTSRGGN